MIDQKLQHGTAMTSSIELPAELSHLEIRQSFQCQQLDSQMQLLEARDHLLQRDVLIKIVQHTQDQAEALVDEARRVAALKHFSFLKIHSLVQQEHQLFIVMESVKGQLLVDWIKEKAAKASTQDRSEGSQERHIVRHMLDLAQAFEEARQLGLGNAHAIVFHSNVESAAFQAAAYADGSAIYFAGKPVTDAVFHQRLQ